MSKYLRNALEQLKHFYIQKIIATGLQQETVQELNKLTVSELEYMYNHVSPLYKKHFQHKITEN